jgi:hypothetical protein
MSDKSGFYIEKKFTLGFVLALCLQTASGLMWAGAAEARLKMLETDVSQAPPVYERLARLEEKVDLTRESVVRIEKRLDAMP